jgi:opacity protein-like surface antigen
VALIAAALTPAAEARADWLITPFVGGTFAGQTIHFDPEQGAGSTQFVFGGGGAWLSDGVFGFEADFAYAPRYFERDNRAGMVTNSYLYTLTGNVIVTLPLSVTRESLRPYVTGGLGMMDGHLEEVANILPELFELQERPSAAVDVGAGVIGFVTRNTGARFDLRYVRSLARDENPLTGALRTKLSFWRITAGVTLRY